MPSGRLKWLRIHAYRNAVPGTYLEFGPGFNVLLGRNGTGKTTLLDLIDMILSRGFTALAQQAFHLEYAVAIDGLHFSDTEREGGVRNVPGCVFEVMVKNEHVSTRRPEPERAHLAGASLHFSYVVAVRAGDQVLVVEGSPMGARLHYQGQSVAVEILGPHSWPIVWAAPRQFFDVSSAIPCDVDGDVAFWAEWAAYAVELGLNVGRFDESLGAYHALMSGDDSLYSGEMHGIPRVRWELERRLDAEAKVYPLTEQMCRFVPLWLVRDLIRELRGDVRREPVEFRRSLRDIPFLDAFLELTSYPDAYLTVRHQERRRAGLGETLVFGAPEFTFMLPNDGGDIQASSLSYGEKRLLAFLWYLACSEEWIIADELVNGFHHEWIARCVELIGSRQAFLASQNPLLLDCLPLEDVDYVRRCFITCHRGEETGGQMRWSNLTDEEAVQFYRAYARETQYVHEILRGQRLW